MKNAQLLSRARWLVAASFVPLMIPAALLLSGRWLEAHVNIHSDVPLIFLVLGFWAVTTAAVVIGVPLMCWRLVAETGIGPHSVRRWRWVIILANVAGCLAFLLVTLLRVPSEPQPPDQEH